MLQPLRLERHEAPAPMLAAIRPFEERFEDTFETLIFFSHQTFEELHRWKHSSDELPAEVVVASRKDASILREMDSLKRVANTDAAQTASLSSQVRNDYRERLLAVYSKLPRQPRDVAALADTLCVGIEREGRILAEAMNCMQPHRRLAPHAKRIPYEGGLVIGLCQTSPPPGRFGRCLIIDGAIASGATLCAVIHELKKSASEFNIFSVHGPCEGLRAVVRFGNQIGVKISLIVGHATVGINKKFYAVDPSDGKSLVLGDVGDTICDLEQGHD